MGPPGAGNSTIMLRSEDILHCAERGLTAVLHPLLTVFWVAAAVVAGGISGRQVPSGGEWFLVAVVFFNVVLLPAGALGIMRWAGLLPERSGSTGRAEVLPLLLTGLCYGMCAWTLGRAGLYVLRLETLAAMACCMVAAAVVPRWRISLPMTAMGLAAGAFLVLLAAGYRGAVVLFCCAVAAAGLLGSSLLALDRDDASSQVRGLAVGISTTVVVMLLWP